jgi:hypothetical protein
MNDFWISVFGEYTLGQTLSMFFFFIIGLTLYQLQEVKQRNVESKRTPKKFNLWFLLKDNVKRFFLAILLIYIQFRFFKELTGQELTEFTALLVGYMGNGIADFSKRNVKGLQGKRNGLINE